VISIPVRTAALFILVSVIVSTITPVRAAGRSGAFNLETETVNGNGTAGPYRLSRRFIGGMVSVVHSDSTDITVTDLDTIARTITFSRPVAVGDTVTVRYALPPEWMKDSYTRPETARPSGVRPPDDYGSYGEKTPKPFPGLRFGGSKTFDINVGSDRQAALNQTLRLAISGKLTDDITLNAVISDQSVPITPEGDTRELNELDRVLIELRGKHFRVDMGDTDLLNDTGRWLSYSRRLSGAKGAVSYGGMEVFASAAVSEGRHMSITISPIEGNQGPYRLIAEDGRSDIAIVPGTEKLWINGDRLVRGINDDYTIDYSTGEVSFTENRIIGSDMRIVCDYEYTSESYRRTFYSAGANGSFHHDRLKIGIVAAREADDADRPVLVDLDDDMKKELRLSGDSPAAFSGLRPAADDSSGTYDLIDGRLVYNPSKTGEYNVTFSWVGENEGSYRYRGGGIYEYVPEESRIPGSGASYEPVVLMDGPESHSVAGMHVSFDPAEALHIEGETAGSSVDQNTLSSLDDNDNDGGAYGFGAALTPSFSAVVPVKLTLSGDHRSRGMRFKPLDRDRSAEENRRWGFPLVMDTAKEVVTEYTAGLAVDGGMFGDSGFQLNGGRFELGSDALSKRSGVSGRFSVSERGSAIANYDHIIREDVTGMCDETIDILEGESSLDIAGFTPSLDYEAERRVGRNEFSHGVSYGEIRTGLATPVFFGIGSKTEWLYRTEQAKRDAWTDSSTVRGGSIELTSAGIGHGTLKTRYARRERFGSGTCSTTDQALVEGSYRPGDGGFSADLSYRAGRSRETAKRKNFIYTGGGRGSYRWEDLNGDGVRDPEEFIPDEHGSYYLYEETLDEYRPVNVVGVFGKVGLKLPRRLTGLITGKEWDIGTETSFEVNERSSAPASDVFFLRLSRFRKHGKTTSGDARIQEDITMPVADGGSLRLRVFRYASYEAEYVTGAERRREDEESARLRLPFGESWDTETTVKHALLVRTMEERSSGDFNVGSWSLDSGISYYPRSSVKTGLAFGGGIDSDDVSDITARYTILKPAVTYYFSGKGRAEMSYSRTAVSADASGRSAQIPYTMARGRKEGVNHDIELSCDYRLTHRMNIIASYTGRKFAGREFEHFARTQLRALF